MSEPSYHPPVMSNLVRRLAWILAAAIGSAVAVPAVSHPRILSYDSLAAENEHVREVARLAARHHVTFGIWGGTVRDLYLRHPFTVISDFDVIFDSSEPGFPAFRDALLEYNHRQAGSMPRVDFHYDIARETDRQLYFHGTGITATKVGLFPDGRVLDPTGTGVRDLETRTFRFRAASGRHEIALQDVGRFTRDLARLISFRHHPATIAKLRGTLERLGDEGRAGDRGLERAMRALRRLATEEGRITFRRLMPLARIDHLHLHHDRLDALGPTFPLGMFLLELFKTVTQAPDERAYREAFRLVGADRFLRRLGAHEEADLLMDPAKSRQELFEAFVFPGSRRSRDLRLTARQVREQALTWIRYAGAFRHLERRQTPGSFARTHLGRRVRALLAPASFLTFSPGADVAFEASTFLDTDFTTGVLDEARTRRTLARWAETHPASPGLAGALAAAGIDDDEGRRGLQEMRTFLQGSREVDKR